MNLVIHWCLGWQCSKAGKRQCKVCSWDCLWSIFVIFMIFPVFLMIFNKVELFSIQSQLFEYLNSICVLKLNKYKYEYHYSSPTTKMVASVQQLKNRMWDRLWVGMLWGNRLMRATTEGDTMSGQVDNLCPKGLVRYKIKVNQVKTNST